MPFGIDRDLSSAKYLNSIGPLLEPQQQCKKPTGCSYFRATLCLSSPTLMPPISLACASTHIVPSVLTDVHGPKLAARRPPSLLWPLDTLGMHPLSLLLPFQLCVSWTLISHLLSPSGSHLFLILPSLYVHYVAPRCPLFSLWPLSTLPWFHSFPLLSCTLLSPLAPWEPLTYHLYPWNHSLQFSSSALLPDLYCSRYF